MIYRDNIKTIVEKYGDKVALICKKEPGITFNQMNSNSNAITAGLNDYGFTSFREEIYPAFCPDG